MVSVFYPVLHPHEVWANHMVDSLSSDKAQCKGEFIYETLLGVSCRMHHPLIYNLMALELLWNFLPMFYLFVILSLPLCHSLLGKVPMFLFLYFNTPLSSRIVPGIISKLNIYFLNKLMNKEISPEQSKTSNNSVGLKSVKYR